MKEEFKRVKIKGWKSFKCDKDWKDKEWLKNEYINKERSTIEIAKQCGITNQTIGYWMKKFKIPARKEHRLLTRERMSEARKGEKHWNWKGGRRITKDGYVLVYEPTGHPRAKDRNFVLEHVLIAEKKLGRYLKKEEIVHHIDGNKANNNPDNLYVCKDNSTHIKLHGNMLKVIYNLYKENDVKFNKKRGEYIGSCRRF